MINFFKDLFPVSEKEKKLRKNSHGLNKRERTKWRKPIEKPIKEWDRLLWAKHTFGKYYYRILVYHKNGVFYSGTRRADLPPIKVDIVCWRYDNE